MTSAPAQRREPVQERSRQTVMRILDAAAAIIDGDGVDAATTRAIADRAGVSYPSLYRFFADRDEVLDRLLERHLTQLDAFTLEAEATWDIRSAADLVSRELDLHVAYYREHPSAARLWMGGRTSPVVADQVRARIKELARRMHEALTNAGLIAPNTDPRVLHLAVELGDRVLDLAYRSHVDFDEQTLTLGRIALVAYIERVVDEGTTS
ncbi:MAG: TetR/AcrR family transcriptional regulator [Mycobacteriaceae bacterium]